MPTILTIDYMRLMLPDSVNINALIKTLQDARSVDSRYTERRDHRLEYQVKGSPQISIEIVTKAQIRSEKKPLQIPAAASPDAHGQDITKQD